MELAGSSRMVGRATNMDTKQKLERIIARNPELKETLQLLQDVKYYKQLHKIVDKDLSKVIVVGRESEKVARLFQLSSLINRGFIHITEVTTPQLLDAYVDEETPSLTQIVDDLVIIKDSRAYVPNKQKSNMIMQVFEQNSDVILYYKGTQRAFTTEHPQLLDYARESGIEIIIVADKETKSIQGEI